ncbi:MAG: hypothetical protein K0R99_4777, partial [Microbacterium sp.]|nr:hypothetical protein [Microbacterium sp.]
MDAGLGFVRSAEALNTALKSRS